MYKGCIYRHYVINEDGVEKSYIGKHNGTNPKKDRWKNGNGYKPAKNKKPTYFWNAIQKHGWDSFEHEIIGYVESNSKEQLDLDLNEWEKYYIEKYDSFYNGYNGTTGGSDGFMKEETKQKISESKKGQKLSEEHKRKLSEAFSGEKHHMYGKHHSEKTIQKMSKPRSEEAKKKMKKPKSDEHKKKLSEAGKGLFAGDKNPRARAVICLETLDVFTTIKEAKEWLGKGDVKACCQGKTKTCGGYHWMYYDEYLKQEEE